mmetsp:Transcript_36250/g.90498  ORF Transcript_36250/g.90498 Transcript_36250/m.90498 type:complete len:340 (-) Transcript_36250:165-1184(-)
MVGRVHAGAHQVSHVGVQTDVVFVGVFVVHDSCDEETVWSRDEAAVFHDHTYRPEPVGFEDLVVLSRHASRRALHIHLGLIRFVVDAQPAAQVDHRYLHPTGLVDLHHQLKQHPRRRHNLTRLRAVGHNHRVQPKPLDPPLLGLGICLEELVACESELGLLGVADDDIAGPARPGVVPKREELWQPDGVVEVVDVADVVEVDDGAQLLGLLVLVDGRVVAGEHDHVATQPHALRQHQLGEAAAVSAQALVLEQLEQVRVRRGLDGEVVGEAGRPAEGLLEPPAGGADAVLRVHVERSGEPLHGVDELLVCEGEGLPGGARGGLLLTTHGSHGRHSSVDR